MWCRRCRAETTAEVEPSTGDIRCARCRTVADLEKDSEGAVRKAREILEKWATGDLFEQIRQFPTQPPMPAPPLLRGQTSEVAGDSDASDSGPASSGVNKPEEQCHNPSEVSEPSNETDTAGIRYRLTEQHPPPAVSPASVNDDDPGSVPDLIEGHTRFRTVGTAPGPESAARSEYIARQEHADATLPAADEPQSPEAQTDVAAPDAVSSSPNIDSEMFGPPAPTDVPHTAMNASKSQKQRVAIPRRSPERRQIASHRTTVTEAPSTAPDMTLPWEESPSSKNTATRPADSTDLSDPSARPVPPESPAPTLRPPKFVVVSPAARDSTAGKTDDAPPGAPPFDGPPELRATGRTESDENDGSGADGNPDQAAPSPASASSPEVEHTTNNVKSAEQGAGPSREGRTVSPKFRVDSPATGGPDNAVEAGKTSGPPDAPAAEPRANRSHSERRIRIDESQPVASVTATGATRSRTQTPPRTRYIDDAHETALRGPHYQEEPPPRSGLTTLTGQFLAYLGVLGLTVGTAIVIYGHFGGHAEYTPTGWLVTTVAQMLLFLGVINLVSGGIEQNNRDVSRRISSLNQQLARLEQVTEQAIRGPRIPAARYAEDVYSEETETADSLTSNEPLHS